MEADVAIDRADGTLKGVSRTTSGKESEFSLHFLNEQDFASWDALVARSPQGTVFCTSWWLRAIGADVRVLGYFEHKQLVAGIALYFKRYLGLRVSTMPEFTPVWGPVIEPSHGTPTKNACRQMNIIRVFADELSKMPVFVQRFHSTLPNWLPFYWKGFRQTSIASYFIEDVSDWSQKGARTPEHVRQQIEKAEESGITVQPCGIDVVWEGQLKRKWTGASGKHRSKALLERLYQAAKANNAGECFAALDAHGSVQASAFAVWDSRKTYYLAGTALRNQPPSGADLLLIRGLICFAARDAKAFEFCNSHHQAFQPLAHAFHCRQLVYNQITKLPPWLLLLLSFQARANLIDSFLGQ